jgi:hypothetical protein
MSESTPANYVPIPVENLSHDFAIHEGSASGEYGELDLVENIHFLFFNNEPTTVNTVFVENGMLVGASTSYELRALWYRRPFVDCDWYVVAQVENTSGTDDGAIKFEISSDTSQNVEITVPAGTSQWTEVGNILPSDTSPDLNAIRMYVKNGASGAVRVHSVTIKPYVATFDGGVQASGFVPIDSEQADADSPLSVALRKVQLDNLITLRKTRGGSIVGWSEDVARAAASQFETTSSTYVLQARIPFKTEHGQTSIEWALVGYMAAGTGSVKLITSKMEHDGTAAQEVALGTTWSSPFTAAQHDYADGGQAALTCEESAPNQYLDVWLKGDGSNKAFLMSLCAWFKDVT